MGRDIVRQNATPLATTQLATIAALVGGSNITKAAVAAGVDRTTVHRWMADDPHFQAALNRAKQEALEAIHAEIRLGATEAVGIVRGIMSDPATGPNFRLRAALALIDRVGASVPERIGGIEVEDIELADQERKGQREHSKLIAGLFS